MKKIFYAMTLLALAFAPVGCSDSDGGGNEDLTAEELAIKNAMEDYVDHTVVATYRSLATTAIELSDLCSTMLENWGSEQTNASMTTADIAAAGAKWKESRRYWELSEAFLFGAAGDYNIDPHIDSWPLDGLALQSVLDNPSIMKDIEEIEGYASANFGSGLLGFHALEYMLFEDGGARPLSKFTRAQLVYTKSVAEDLRDQCVLLEAAWIGNEVSDEKAEILENAELEPSFDYGWSMKNAGVTPSRYSSYYAAAEELLQGAIDIASEVGSQKIGRPAIGGEASYVESPYSRNSQTDFADNIRSIQNAYEGSNAGDASLSSVVKSRDAALDSRCREAIANAISVIEAAKAPFVLYYADNSWDSAVDACTDLEDVLTEVQALFTK